MHCHTAKREGCVFFFFFFGLWQETLRLAWKQFPETKISLQLWVEKTWQFNNSCLIRCLTDSHEDRCHVRSHDYDMMMSNDRRSAEDLLSANICWSGPPQTTRDKLCAIYRLPFTLIRKSWGLLLQDFPLRLMLSTCLSLAKWPIRYLRVLFEVSSSLWRKLTALQMIAHLHKHGFVCLAYIIPAHFRLVYGQVITVTRAIVFPLCVFFFFLVVFVCSRSHLHSSSFVRMIKVLI